MPAIAPRRQRQAAGVNNRPAGAPASLAGARPHMRKPHDAPTMTGIYADDDAHHPDDDAHRTTRRCGERHDDEMLNRVPPLVPPPGGADGPVVDARRFRDGMSRVAASVHVVTTDGPAGRAGFTATAVAPVTDSPASLLVCIDAAGRSARALAENGVFCVNTLAFRIARSPTPSPGARGLPARRGSRSAAGTASRPARRRSRRASSPSTAASSRRASSRRITSSSARWSRSASAPRRRRSPTGSGGTTGCRRYPGPLQAPTS